MAMPKFDDGSWDNTIWSLWGLLYPSSWAKSDQALKTRITVRYAEVHNELAKIGKPAGDLRKTVAEWRSEAYGYGRSIAYGEAKRVARRLDLLLALASDQVQLSRLAARSKPPKAWTGEATSPLSELRSSSFDDEKDVDDDVVVTVFGDVDDDGSTTATATADKVVTPRRVAPTPAQNWARVQRQMAAGCDNSLRFGARAVDQPSVLRELRLIGGYTVRQYHGDPEGSLRRVMTAERPGSRTRQFWTLGLAHQERRAQGEFSVYERIGLTDRFVYVSGKLRPEHIAAGGT
jgi:hypothetical protein